MDTPEKEDGHRRRGGYSATPQHQESPFLGDFSSLCPPNSLESCLQDGDPGPEQAAPAVGDGEPLWGLTLAEQATEVHRFSPHNVVQRFNISPDVYSCWHHQTSFFLNQEAQPPHDASRRHLNFDAEMPRHSYIPGSRDSYTSHNHAGYSWGVPPPSLPNLGHSLLSNGGPQESSSWEQIIDASNMPFQYPCDQEKPIQLPEDWKSSFVFSSPTGEVSDLVVYGQNGDGATYTQKSSSGENGSTSQDRERNAEPNSVTPRRGSKRKAEAIKNGGCKRCNCRRSKCLKLYCECFAAGVYCIDSCTCEDCYNSYDFEDTVLEMRKQIESRNPLAFARKVVQNGNNSLPDRAEGGGSEASPSSVRHIRGCNCRKSHCVKKYCDCFQAKVGCSDECNCEGCWNPYSPKSAAGQRIERRERSPHGTLDGNGMRSTPDSIGTGTGGQSALTSEGTVNMLNNTPSPSPLACSKHPNTRGCSSSTQAERCQRIVPLCLPCSPIDTPPSGGDKAPPHLVGVSITHDTAKGVNISDTGTSSQSNAASANSPN